MNANRTPGNVTATSPATSPARDNRPTAVSPAASPTRDNRPTAVSPAASPTRDNRPTAVSPAASPTRDNRPTAVSPAASPTRDNRPTAVSPAEMPIKNNRPTAVSPVESPIKNNRPTAVSPAATPAKNNVLGATNPLMRNHWQGTSTGRPIGTQPEWMPSQQPFLPETYQRGMPQQRDYMDYYDPMMQSPVTPQADMVQPATQPMSIFQPAQQAQPMMPMNGTRRTSIMTSGQGVRESVLTAADFTQGFLRTQIGRYVKVEFVLGTNMFVDREGELVRVGTDYIILQEPETDDYLLCDIYSIRFIRFYY